jgi:hypothetical protein
MEEMYGPLLDYDCGDSSSEELLGSTGSSRWQLAEAHFAIGVDLLSDGDRRGAAEHFQRCVDTYVFEYWDYKWGLAFLERLQRDPSWPPWIPMKANTSHRRESEMGGDVEEE